MHRARQERAAIMEQKKKEEKKREEKKREEKKQKLNPPRPKPPTTETVKKPVPEARVNVHSDLVIEEEPEQVADKKEVKEKVKTLEHQCSKLGRDLDETQIMSRTYYNKMGLLEDKIDSASSERADLRRELDILLGKKQEMEREIDEFSIFKNYTNSHISSLQKEINNEKERAEEYKRMYEQESKLKEEELNEYEQELSNLKQQMEGISQQNSQLFDFIKNLQEENEALHEEKHQIGVKIVQEVNATSNEKNRKLNILMGENKALQNKLKELEESRTKNNEVFKRKEDENGVLKTEIENLKKKIKTDIETRKQQVELVAQRETKLASIEARYAMLESQFKKLIEDNHKEQPVKPKMKFKAVNADPHLFE